MSKLKSHSGAGKRFKITGSGRIKRRRAFRNHILTKKSPKQKRRLRTTDVLLKPCDQKAVKRMLMGS